MLEDLSRTLMIFVRRLRCSRMPLTIFQEKIGNGDLFFIFPRDVIFCPCRRGS